MELNTFIDRLICEKGRERDKLIPILQAVQSEYGYISEASVDQIALKTNIPASNIYGVITFYSQFNIHPGGKHVIRVCCGTACHVKGGEQTLSKLKQVLNVETGETTQDGEFTLQEVACIGCCGLAPVVMVDETPMVKLSPERVTLESLEEAIGKEGAANV